MAEPVNLLELSSFKFKQFLNSFDYILSDCDGVLWTPRPNIESGKFINLMKKMGKKVHFVSNNSLRSKEDYKKLFAAINIDDGYENLTLPSAAIGSYLKSIRFNKHIYCIACPETVRVLREQGFKVKTGPTECPQNFQDFEQFLDDDLEIGAVVTDSDFSTNLAKMQKAITYLRRKNVLFINGATDHYISLRPGTLSISSAVFVDIIAQEVNNPQIQLAKPARNFAEFAMKRAGISLHEASRVLLIGDMIDQDIKLGKVAGFQTLLVLTNTSVDKMLEHEITPHYYAQSLGSLVAQIWDLEMIEKKFKTSL